MRPETLLRARSTRSAGEGGDGERLQAVVDDLVARLEQLEDRLARVDASRSVDSEPVGHTLFVSTPTGYTLVEREGPPPPPGSEVTVDGRDYRATGCRHSPFPADRRPCVIAEVLGG